MYSADGGYNDSNRKILGIISIMDNNGVYADVSDNLQEIDITESLVSNSELSIGTAIAAEVSMTLINITPEQRSFIFKGKKMQVTFQNTYETTTETTDEETDETTEVTAEIVTETPIGIYYIDSIEWSSYHSADLYTAKIKAYDGLSKCDTEYEPNTTKADIRTLIGQIASTCGITSDSTKWSSAIFLESYPTDVSCREMIGYLAGLQGTVAYIDRDGKLSSKWYTSCDKVIDSGEQYSDGLTIDDTSTGTKTVTIKYLESGTKSKTIVYPSNAVIGESISFENPLITEEEQLQDLYNSIIKSGDEYLITFTPLTLKWRGDPTIETGQIVGVKDRNDNTIFCYVMEREMHFDGGFDEEYKCYGENETTVSFKGNGALSRFDRKLSAMETAITDATATIGDIQAMQEGTFTVIRSATDDKNIGWKIESDVTDNYILANIGGIGFSDNGGESFDAAAIWIDDDGGHIAGEFITADSITANQISFDSNFDDAINDEISSGGIVIGDATITGFDKSLANILSGQQAQINDADGNITALQTERARYLLCSSVAGTFTKSCTLVDSSDFTIQTGTTITVRFANTAYYPKQSPSKGIQLSIVNGTKTINTSSVYYNGSKLKSDSVSCWSASSTVSFIYEPEASGGHWAMLDNVATTILSDWCLSTDRTLIDGASIATGTIEAKSIYAGVIAKRTQFYDTISGTTQFNLDEDYILTSNTSTKVTTKMSAGYLKFGYDGSNIGYVAAMGTSTPPTLVIGASESNVLSLGYGDYEGSHNAVVEIGKGNATTGHGGQMEVRSDQFSGIVNLFEDWNEDKTSFTPYYTMLGTSKISNTYGYYSPIMAIKMEDIFDNNRRVFSELDVAYSTYTDTTVGIRGVTPTGTSPWLRLGTANMYWDNSKVLTMNNITNTESGVNLALFNIGASTAYFGKYPVVSGYNFDDFLTDRVSHLKVSVNGEEYTCYWSK